ncbi:carboxylesterase/lipase family protein [Marinimicrobium agarilyticum]|uniref:carboxylesterase/lipase family protein n=1 Tax=Marinimicrobium agarilyticum TaxID=306546 RepID=UPI00056110A9|nr:carboxylesterase family protein [Marinimicrobium agarilyticum]
MTQKKYTPIGWLTLAALLGIAVAGCSLPPEQHQPPLVTTTYGTSSGHIEDGVFSFKGIPYAQAERFMPPRKPDSWQGIRQHTEFGPVAMQINDWTPGSAMDEKRLFTANVWTSGLDDGKKRPVILWLHGGGFSVGSSNDPVTDGHRMAETGDIVFVSVNHRLNILGFLDLSDFGDQYAHSANVGMLDIVAALEWIKDNIEAFGGDPDNVTVVGESGGGGKVGTLMSMPAAEGLFHKAIIQSGTLVNVMTQEKSRAVGRALVAELELSGDDLGPLQTLPYKELVAVGNKALEKTVGLRVPGTRTMFGFGPVPDGVNLLQQPFSPGFADTSESVPLLIGTTLNELVRTAYDERDLTLEEAKARLADTYGDDTDAYLAHYADAYPDYTPQDLLSIDTLFRPTTIETADTRSEKRDAPVYSYLLTWKSPVDGGTRGSFHGLDIPLAFNNIELGQHWTGTSEEARRLADVMSQAWINFAHTGDPNVAGQLPEWPPYSRENGATMIFDATPEVVNNHDRALMELIDDSH